MLRSKSVVSIENVVSTASVNQRIDLVFISKNFPDTEYRPERFPGLVFRLKSPKTSILVFGSGNMVCTGAKSEDQSVTAIKTLVGILKKGGVGIRNDPHITIRNVVASANLGGRVRLEQAARILPRSMYEPEQFPGLIHRMVDPSTVVLVFASGKLVCAGAKKSSDIYRSVGNLQLTLEEKRLMHYD